MRKSLVVIGAASALLLLGAVAEKAGVEEERTLVQPAVSDQPVTGLGAAPPVATVPPVRARPKPRRSAVKPRRPGNDGAARERAGAADVRAGRDAPVQQRVLALINDNRRRAGCRDLTLDRRLIDAAGEHAADMVRHDYFAHESRDGSGAGDRVRDNGYRWRRYGENIARGSDSPHAVVDVWMHSPPHRANILDCRLRQVGVGLAVDGDHTAYWVQDLATPMG